MSINFKFFVILLFSLFAILGDRKAAIAQKENVFLHPQKFYKKYFPDLKIKRALPDSVYIKSYPNYLAASVQVLSPFIRTDLVPDNGNAGGKVSFRTSIADIAGAAVSYRYVTAGFAFLLNSGMQLNDNYAKTKYRTATIRYNSRAFVYQFKYIRIRGLTDIGNGNNSDPSKVYIKRPDITTKEFQFEGLYNPNWKKYSFMAPLTFSERQIRSSGGLLLNMGIFYMQMSGDSALIDKTKQEYYRDVDNIKVIRSLSLRLAPGIGGNLVYRERFYGSLAFFPSYDLYLYKYLHDPHEKVRGHQTFVFAMDGRASLGYQSRRLFAGIRYEIETRKADMRSLQSQNLYSYVGVEVGYRFNAPRFVKKVYKETMPPGM